MLLVSNWMHAGPNEVADALSGTRPSGLNRGSTDDHLLELDADLFLFHSDSS